MQDVLNAKNSVLYIQGEKMSEQKMINIKQFGLPANVIVENYDYIGRMTNTKLRYIYCGRYILDCQKKVVYDMGEK